MRQPSTFNSRGIVHFTDIFSLLPFSTIPFILIAGLSSTFSLLWWQTWPIGRYIRITSISVGSFADKNLLRKAGSEQDGPHAGRIHCADAHPLLGWKIFEHFSWAVLTNNVDHFLCLTTNGSSLVRPLYNSGGPPRGQIQYRTTATNMSPIPSTRYSTAKLTFGWEEYTLSLYSSCKGCSVRPQV